MRWPALSLNHFPAPDAALAECARLLEPSGALALSWWEQPARQRVRRLLHEVVAELGRPPAPEVPQGHDTLRFSGAKAYAGLLRGAKLDGVAVASYRTTHLMLNARVQWQAGMSEMAIVL
jgi:SAM-dependent methyltransferase